MDFSAHTGTPQVETAPRPQSGRYTGGGSPAPSWPQRWRARRPIPWPAGRQKTREQVALVEAIQQIMAARGLTRGEVTRRVSRSGADRSAMYRVLRGTTREPQLSLLLAVCAVLDVSPTELLQLAQLPRFGPK